MSRELDTAVAAAKAGAEVVMDYWNRGVVMRTKEASSGRSYDLVSEADERAEDAVVARIRQDFPDHAFLGEESHTADAGAEHLWVIDPLDGTNNFAHRIPQFSVSVAYYRRGEAVCGVVLNPVRDELHRCEKGGGAFLNGEPVRVNAQATLDTTIVGLGFYYDRGAMMRATLEAVQKLFESHVHGIRRFGGAALDLCQVGGGQFGAFFEYALSPWDFAAGRLFVEEAGGRVTTCTGDPLPLARTTVLASNGLLHDAMLRIVGDWRP